MTLIDIIFKIVTNSQKNPIHLQAFSQALYPHLHANSENIFAKQQKQQLTLWNSRRLGHSTFRSSKKSCRYWNKIKNSAVVITCTQTVI